MAFLLRALCAAVALTLSAPAAPQLSAVEQRMVAIVDAEQERTVAMLKKWVN